MVAFRLAAHDLTERLPDGGLVRAAGRCGVQDSPPGSAALALHARVTGATRRRIDAALTDDRTLLRSWCMRGAPFVVPTADLPVFTTGVLPPTEAALRHLLPGMVPALDRLGLGLTEAVDLAGAEIRAVLSGRHLTVTELGTELAERISGALSAARRRTWEAEGPYSPGQPLGEAVVHFCLRVLALQGVVCFARRSGTTAPFVLADEWLGHEVPATDAQQARAELLRRYLRCYGPSTRRDFAAWLGVRTADTDPWWTTVEDELAPVDLGRRAWLLAEDLDALRSAPAARGVRLLPPRDPYTQLGDRGTIVDRAHQRLVWTAVGPPGAVLVDGEIAGTWRPRTHGGSLTLTVTTFGPLASRQRRPLEDEAEAVATLRGASSVVLVVDRG